MDADGVCMEGLELAKAAAKLADDKKGLDIVIYDLRGLSDVTDFTSAMREMSSA